MSLDAFVFCDCFEKGCLRGQPRSEWAVYVDKDGRRESGAANLNEQMAFDSWHYDACEHERGILLHHRLGNISLIGFFREAFNPYSDQLPILAGKVIYSGSHCCDYLNVTEVERLRGEIEVIATVCGKNAQDEQFIRRFEQQLRELADCSLRVRKPIAF